jgi:hypothetical protein
MNVGELQRKLSLWAEQDKGHQFFDLYHLLHDKDCVMHPLSYGKDQVRPTNGEPDAVKVASPVRRGE